MKCSELGDDNDKPKLVNSPNNDSSKFAPSVISADTKRKKRKLDFTSSKQEVSVSIANTSVDMVCDNENTKHVKNQPSQSTIGSGRDRMKSIEQRKKMITYGKNTVGYDEYLRRVPRLDRNIRNPDHPQTPDPLKDMSWRRFKGQVSVWRRKLHFYDPPDLMTNNTERNAATTLKLNNNQHSTKEKFDSIQMREIADAEKCGLSIAFANESNSESKYKTDTLVIGDIIEENVPNKSDALLEENESDDDLL